MADIYISVTLIYKPIFFECFPVEFAFQTLQHYAFVQKQENGPSKSVFIQ